MNERIDQLAREAGFKHPDHVGLCEEYAYFDHVRFGELIVKECTDICEYWDKSVNYTSHGQIIADKIKKHFGVE